MADVKPQDKTVQFRVRDATTSDETVFKVKRGTAMKKVLDAYAKRRGVQAEMLRFLFDGTAIQSEDTPLSLDLDDGDLVDAHLQQVGGCL